MGSGRLIGALVGALVLGACSGPKPVVDDVRVEAPARPGEPYRVDATVRNRTGGRGEVSVVVRLRDPASGAVYEEEKTVRLEGDAVVHAVAELHAPLGSYVPEVRAEYPPR